MEFVGVVAPVSDIVEDGDDEEDGDGGVLGGGSGGGALADDLAAAVVPVPKADEENVCGGVGTDALAALLAAEGDAVLLADCKDGSFELGESRQFMVGFMEPDVAESPPGLL